MPKYLPPDQVEALREKGVVFPGEVLPIPSETVARALGDIGLPHSEKVERLDDTDTGSETIDSLGFLENPGFDKSFHTTLRHTRSILGLIDEYIPNADASIHRQIEILKPTFEIFERHNLQPEVVLTPTHRDLEFWENLARVVQDSPLNPDRPTGNEKVLRNGGFWVIDSLKNQWRALTNQTNQGLSWQLSVVSGLDQTYLTRVTSYGYTDNENEFPNSKLDDLLTDLRLPLVALRSVTSGNNSPLTQPNIHPTPDAYLMHQLTRIVQNKEPIDIYGAWSWLNGTLANNVVPVGSWSAGGNGQVELSWGAAGGVSSSLGIRPSVRANNA